VDLGDDACHCTQVIVASLIQDVPYLGLALSCTLVVVDFTLLMYARLALAPQTKKKPVDDTIKGSQYALTAITPDSTVCSLFALTPSYLVFDDECHLFHL
jgi:hypothetical protein